MWEAHPPTPYATKVCSRIRLTLLGLNFRMYRITSARTSMSSLTVTTRCVPPYTHTPCLPLMGSCGRTNQLPPLPGLPNPWGYPNSEGEWEPIPPLKIWEPLPSVPKSCMGVCVCVSKFTAIETLLFLNQWRKSDHTFHSQGITGHVQTSTLPPTSAALLLSSQLCEGVWL